MDCQLSRLCNPPLHETLLSILFVGANKNHQSLVYKLLGALNYMPFKPEHFARCWPTHAHSVLLAMRATNLDPQGRTEPNRTEANGRGCRAKREGAGGNIEYECFHTLITS